VLAADLRSAPTLTRASDAGLTRLAERCAVRRFSRGEFLFGVGEPVTRVLLITSGRVAAVLTSRAGSMLVFLVAQAGELAGHVSIFEPTGHLASAKAVSDGTVVSIPADAYLSLLSAEPMVALDFARELATIIRALNESVADLVFLDLERRLARNLIETAPGQDVVHLEVNQSDLGARLGATRQSVNQAFGRLARRGFVQIENPREIRILDRDGIGAFIEGLDGHSHQ
jgi:CRP/FNR family transcriptional regulator, cyclic AMP receptor protein